MKDKKGITLIALIVTIIVLLILAGVTIAMLTGENGILEQAENAKKEITIYQEKEQIALVYNAAIAKKMEKTETDIITAMNEELSNSKADATAKEVEEENSSYIKVTFNKTGNVYTIDSEGNILESTSSVGGSTPSITEILSIGQYVSYDPTKADAAKTQDLDTATQAKLTYTSPTGGYSSETGKIEHGNGYGDQIYTAKPLSELKWRILSVSNDKIELISEVPVTKNDTTDNSGNFVMQGGIGYLYSEQELNSICAIYGYGYGADTSVGASYTVGGPEDTESQEIRTITGTGARSITIDDIVEIENITEVILKTVNANYGDESNPPTEVYYPTLSSTESTYKGQSTTKKIGFKNSYYNYPSSKIQNTKIREILFSGNYWLASRCIMADSTIAYFRTRDVGSDSINANSLCNGTGTQLYQYPSSESAVRPIVTLKPEVIDISNATEESGTDGNAWKLK